MPPVDDFGPSCGPPMDDATQQLKLKALQGLGFLCSRYGEYLLAGPVHLCFCHILRLQSTLRAHIELKILVLDNLYAFLTEEERRLVAADLEYKQQQQHLRARGRLKPAENLNINEMGDIQSGYCHISLLSPSYLCVNYFDFMGLTWKMGNSQLTILSFLKNAIIDVKDYIYWNFSGFYFLFANHSFRWNFCLVFEFRVWVLLF